MSGTDTPPLPTTTTTSAAAAPAAIAAHSADCPPEDELHRAVHRIRLSALEHNYRVVEQAAAKQRCSVITVVKADGYGHGAIATALHLADCCGADAFAVATLEEAIHLRKAFEMNPPGRWSKQLASHFHVAHDSTHPAYWAITAASNATSHVASSSSVFPSQATTTATSSSTATSTTNSITTTMSSGSASTPSSTLESSISLRPNRIRILVLGPPVGFPRSFDDYYYHGIELMVSGPEVAQHLLDWIKDETNRKRTEVERAANEAKAKALLEPLRPRDIITGEEKKMPDPEQRPTDIIVDPFQAPTNTRQQLMYPSNTLGNMSGQDLAKEVRALLLNQKNAKETLANGRNNTPANTGNGYGSVPASISSETSSMDSTGPPPPNVVDETTRMTNTATVFAGIEAVARTAQVREMAAHAVPIPQNAMQKTMTTLQQNRRRLRWHALVETGMGRDGFRTDPSQLSADSRRDTVEILKELVDAEIHQNAPIEFHGMCTHMAEANSTSTFTHDQMQRFLALVRRVREAGITIPTISTDNSAALLTPTLTHFDPDIVLNQPGVNTRGFVRVGGAIYGQRPAFPQLLPVSTLCASVRHVAILSKGESVGYDRAYVAPHDVRIATLTIGFADGYPRALGNGAGSVEIRGKVYPIAGNICMDMLMVDLGPVEDEDESAKQVQVGDKALLWGPALSDEGPGKVRLQDIAAALNTTQSSLTCGLDKLRVRRSFI